MGRARNLVSLSIGFIQCMLGGIAVVFAYLVYATPQMRETLVIASEEVYLCMFVALIFSMLSIVSGLLLMHGENSRE